MDQRQRKRRGVLIVAAFAAAVVILALFGTPTGERDDYSTPPGQEKFGR